MQWIEVKLEEDSIDPMPTVYASMCAVFYKERTVISFNDLSPI